MVKKCKTLIIDIINLFLIQKYVENKTRIIKKKFTCGHLIFLHFLGFEPSILKFFSILNQFLYNNLKLNRLNCLSNFQLIIFYQKIINSTLLIEKLPLKQIKQYKELFPHNQPLKLHQFINVN